VRLGLARCGLGQNNGEPKWPTRLTRGNRSHYSKLVAPGRVAGLINARALWWVLPRVHERIELKEISRHDPVSTRTESPMRNLRSRAKLKNPARPVLDRDMQKRRSLIGKLWQELKTQACFNMDKEERRMDVRHGAVKLGPGSTPDILHCATSPSLARQDGNQCRATRKSRVKEGYYLGHIVPCLFY